MYIVNIDIWLVFANRTMVRSVLTYVIERDLPGLGGMNRAQFKDVATTSNDALAKLAGKTQWEHSYIVDNKSFERGELTSGRQ